MEISYQSEMSVSNSLFYKDIFMVLLNPGIKIHGYTLVEFINQGSTAEVWRITDESGIEKAIKIFSPVQKVDDSTLDLLIDEFKLLFRLDHPHILRSEIMGAYQKVPYIIMPYYDGNLAAEMIQRSQLAQSASSQFRNWFSEEECLDVMQQVGGGLAYLHEQGIIHQDVKPENILYNRAITPPHYVLTDFGISTRIKENMARMTLARNQVYALTPAYAAPEQFKGRPVYKSDVFSLGALLFEMSEGRLPFHRQGHALDSYGNVPRPEFRNDRITVGFRNIILNCLSEHPDHRPGAKELEEFVVRYRGNAITAFDTDQVRSDKITILQPQWNKTNKEDGRLNAIEGFKNPEHEFSKPPSDLYDLRGEMTRSNQLLSTSGGSGVSGRKTNFWVWMIGVFLFIAGCFWAYTRWSKVSIEEKIELAEEAFRNGDISEANQYFTWLIRKTGREEYFEQKKITDKILEGGYLKVLPFENDRAPVMKGGKWGFIDIEGSLVIPCQFIQVTPFSEGTAVACITRNECGIIDLSGNVKAPFIYSGFQDGRPGEWVMTRIENHEKVSVNYDF